MTRVLAIDPGKNAGFALLDASALTPGKWRSTLPTAPVVECTSDLRIAATWKADFVICERQYCGEAGKLAVSTLAFGAGTLCGALFVSSGAQLAYGMTPHAWKDLLCPGGGTIRKDVFCARLARALPEISCVDKNNQDQLDAVGLGWAFCAALAKPETLVEFSILMRNVITFERTNAKKKPAKKRRAKCET